MSIAPIDFHYIDLNPMVECKSDIRWMWPQLFALTLVAHIVHGVILGILVHHWLKPEDDKWLFAYLKTN